MEIHFEKVRMQHRVKATLVQKLHNIHRKMFFPYQSERRK